MTGAEIEYILRRMPQIEKAVIKKESLACFYVGKRREVIEINENIYLLRDIIEDIKSKEDKYIQYIIDYGIMKGKSDEYLIIRLPMSKNCYYRLKHKIHERIFNCCIEKGIVSYDEIFLERIQ